MSTEDQARLNALFARIRRKGISGNQEVIETYNALLEVFKTCQAPREEWLPVDEFSEDLGGQFPPIEKGFTAATSKFSKVLYGEIEITVQDLHEFRKNVESVLTFFSLSMRS